MACHYQNQATSLLVWDLINPSKDEKPLHRIEPTKPEPAVFPAGASAEDKSEAKEDYKEAKKDYKEDYSRWKHEVESFAKIIEYIYDTVSASNVIFIQDVEVHPWDILRALKARLAPTDSARMLEVERLYKKVSTGPTTKQSYEAWLDDYIQMYSKAKHIGVAEVKDPRRAYRDFLLAISDPAPILAQTHEFLLDEVTDHEAQHFKLIDKFRNHVRLHDIKHTAAHHHAFAAEEGSSSKEEKGKGKGRGNASYRGQSPGPPPCIVV